jgi:hypothetical protein
MLLIAATVGNGRSSNRHSIRFTSTSFFATASSPAANMPVNSVTSAPTMKTGLPEVTITPFIRRLRDRLGSASKSLRAAAFSLLTESPVRSNFSSTMPSPSAAALRGRCRAWGHLPSSGSRKGVGPLDRPRVCGRVSAPHKNCEWEFREVSEVDPSDLSDLAAPRPGDRHPPGTGA